MYLVLQLTFWLKDMTMMERNTMTDYEKYYKYAGRYT